MQTILMIHTKCACKEYTLPKLKNDTFSILLEGSLYGTRKNDILTLENVEGAWYFALNKQYTLRKKGQPYLDFSLQNGDIWEVSLKSGENLSIIIVQTSKQFPVFQKYILENTDKITFGKNSGNMIGYDFFQLVSGVHGIVEKKENGIWIEDFSTNGIFSHGKRIYGRKRLAYGEEITLFGLHIIVLEDILCVGGIKNFTTSDQLIPWKGQISAKGKKEYVNKEEFFHRSPRQMPICNKERIYLSLPQTNSTKVEKRRGFRSFYSYWKKMKGQEEQRQEEQKYQKELKKIKERYQEHVKILTKGYPSAAECCSYGKKSVALWNRNLGQEDFWFLRLGLGEKEFDVDICGQGETRWLERLHKDKENFTTLSRVPIGISIKEHVLWGIVGGKEKEGAYAVVYAMLAQIMASYCYTDVKVGSVYKANDRLEEKRWEFAKWVPHIWSEDKRQRYLAGTKEEISELFDAWELILKKKEGIPKIILFLESMDLLEGENQKRYRELTQSGLVTFLLVENFHDLPNTCGHIIENTEQFQGIYQTCEGQSARQTIEFDEVSIQVLTSFSKRLSEIQVTVNKEDGRLPEHLGFLEMHQALCVEDLKVREHWRRNVANQSMAACIGMLEDGSHCYLDAHEKKDGPHGLLAGTTGSGKSEVLLTYLLSLAVRYSPSEVAFVLIDFKGGGMANLLKEIPHVAGCITNLSGSQVERGLLAIKSENTRRQKLFAKYRVNHISEYASLRQYGQVKEAVPHLFLVVDEFAELKNQVPEFLQELIHVAQVGRSLGMHLLLSTQKPSGIVSENIWSNSRFRLCLRVQTKEDSMEVLRKADASYLTGYGQGYLQIGEEEKLKKFQAAYTGSPYQPREERETVFLIKRNGSKELLEERRVEKQKNRQTELEVITRYLCRKELEKEFGRAKKLWLSPLPNSLFLDDIVKKEANQNKGVSFCSIIGVCDAPSKQEQFPYEVDFLNKGNYGVIGSLQSGKTTLVESLLLGLIRKYSPKQLHAYLLDFNSKRLAVFESAKHVGGVIMAGEEEKLERFFEMLTGIISERRELQKERKEFPFILVILEDMENFRKQTKDIYLDRLYHLMRDGSSLGVYFLFTAGSFGIRGIPGYFREGIKECVALSLSDKVQYEDALGINRISILPEQKKGRGLVVKGETLELQVALPQKEPEDYKRNKKIREAVENMWADQIECLPRKIPSLPDSLSIWELEKNPDFHKFLEKPNEILLGYDKVKATPYFLSLKELDGYMISGKRRTGKKNLLALLAFLGKRKGMECIFFGRKNSMLANWVNWADDFMEDSREWIQYLCQIGEGKNEKFLLVEDIKDFFERVEMLGIEEVESVSGLILEGRKKGLHWIFAMNPEDYLTLLRFDVFSTIVENERGIHLGGQLNEQKMFRFENFSYREECARMPSGTGVATDREHTQTGRTIATIYYLQSMHCEQ